MIRRIPTSDRDGGIVEIVRGRARRSWGILDGRVGTDGLWILPEAVENAPPPPGWSRCLGARPSLDGASAAHRLHRLNPYCSRSRRKRCTIYHPDTLREEGERRDHRRFAPTDDHDQQNP